MVCCEGWCQAGVRLVFNVMVLLSDNMAGQLCGGFSGPKFRKSKFERLRNASEKRRRQPNGGDYEQQEAKRLPDNSVVIGLLADRRGLWLRR